MFKESAGRRVRVRTLLVALLAAGAAGGALAQAACARRTCGCWRSRVTA